MDYKIINTKDVSMGKEMGYTTPIVRIVYDVRINKAESKDVLLKISSEIVGNHIKSESVNCMGFYYWLPQQSIGKEAAYAGIDWAPNGEWGDADTAIAGFYDNYKYKVMFIGVNG